MMAVGCCGSWLSVVSLLLIVVYSQGHADHVVVSGAFWDNEQVTVRRGENVSITCRLALSDDLESTDLRGPAVFRLVHSHADRTLLVSDNANLSTSFSRLGRYQVTYSPPGAPLSDSEVEVKRSASVTLQIHGVQGEDSGTVACQQLNNDEHIAYSDINVHVAVDEIFVTLASTPNTDAVRLLDGSDVIFVDNSTTSGVLGCVAVISRGGYQSNPPEVDVVLLRENGSDSDVVTSWFRSAVDSRASVTRSGLSVNRIEKRLAWTDEPRSLKEYNGRILRCVARSEGFEELQYSSARLIVHYTPVIVCAASNLSTAYESNVTFSCTVTSNPISEITWSAAMNDSSESYDVNSDSSVTLSITTASEGEADISLSIHNVQQRHFRSYIIRAFNVIGDVTAEVNLGVAFVERTTTQRVTSTSTTTPNIGTTSKKTASDDGDVFVGQTVEVDLDGVLDAGPLSKLNVDHAMHNDAVFDEDLLRPVELAQPTALTTPDIDVAAPVKAENVEVATSSTSVRHLYCASPVTYLTKHLFGVCIVACVIQRLTV